MLSNQRYAVTCLWLLVLWFVCPSIHATPVSHLFETRVPVANGSATELNQQQADANVQKAFLQVLIKVTGDAEIQAKLFESAALDNPKIAQTSLQAYNPETLTLPNGKTQLFMRYQFSAKAIKQFLEQQAIGVWSKNRPLTLVTFSNSDAGQPPVMQALHALKGWLTWQGQQLGLPLRFITGASNLPEQEEQPSWQTLAKQYGGDAVLTLSILQAQQGNVRLQWQLSSVVVNSSWQTSTATLEQGVIQGISQLTNLFVQAYNNNGNQQLQTVMLTISEVDNIAGFAELTQYLQSISLVKEVTLQSIKADTLLYRLRVIGGASALKRALALDHRLQPVAVIPAMNSDSSSMVYQWNS